MKKFLFLMLLTGTVSAEATSKLYNGKCKNTHPLSTYEACSMNSASGYGAYLCALNDAIVDCKQEANVDCVEVGHQLDPKVSLEFIGYKACEAKVVVRGWK